MNRSPVDADDTGLWKVLLKGRDDISWAGASAGDRGFCFGTETGEVFWTNFEGVQYGDLLANAALDDDDEAVNGIAFNAGRMVVTTRSGSAIWKNFEGKASKRKAVRIGVGSHGVVSALDGAFLMPLNVGGLMSVQDKSPKHFAGYLCKSDSMDLNIYRAASLASPDGAQVLAVAARSGGVAVGTYKPGGMLNLDASEWPGADVIDVCPTGHVGFPVAAYALTRDNHILAFNNVLNLREHDTVRYKSMTGVAYRILSAGDFVFVLTDKALHVVHNLVAHSPGLFRVNRRTRNTSCPLEAVDINLVGKRWLLVLLADSVLRLDLNALARDLASDFEERVSEPTDVWSQAIFKVRHLDSQTSEFALVK